MFISSWRSFFSKGLIWWTTNVSKLYPSHQKKKKHKASCPSYFQYFKTTCCSLVITLHAWVFLSVFKVVLQDRGLFHCSVVRLPSDYQPNVLPEGTPFIFKCVLTNSTVYVFCNCDLLLSFRIPWFLHWC